MGKEKGLQMESNIRGCSVTQRRAVALAVAGCLPAHSRPLDKERRVRWKGEGGRKSTHVPATSFQCKHCKQACSGSMFSGNTCFYWTQCKNFLLMEFSLNNREKKLFSHRQFWFQIWI